MIALRISLVLFVALAAGCSDDETSSSTTPDTGTTVVDTGGTQTDTASPPADTNTTPTDTGSTPTDTSVADATMEAATGKTFKVEVGTGGNTFTPATLDIKVGDTVEWTWKGDFHTVTESTGTTCTKKSGGFDSTLKSTGFVFTQKFTTAGTVNYICTPHCALGMKGTINIK